MNPSTHLRRSSTFAKKQASSTAQSQPSGWIEHGLGFPGVVEIRAGSLTNRRRKSWSVRLDCTFKLHYGRQSALDTTLAWGDILTITATQVSSDRVPISQLGMLCSVLVLAWVAVSLTLLASQQFTAISAKVVAHHFVDIMNSIQTPEVESFAVNAEFSTFPQLILSLQTASAKGDYRYKAASNQRLFGQHQQVMGLAAINSSTTWVMFVPVALACYASLVSHDVMPKTTFAASRNPGELPAQLEVLVAVLFTVSSWRGIYAGLRPYI